MTKMAGEYSRDVCLELVCSPRLQLRNGHIAADQAYALVEFIGKFSTMEAQWRSLDDRGSLGWIEEDNTVLMCHFFVEIGDVFVIHTTIIAFRGR